VEETKNILFMSRRFFLFVSAGQDSDGVATVRQTLRYFMAPLGVSAWPGRGEKIREEKDAHQVFS
jgi:hypothetical protein